jgi:RNA polymerase sigma-70 factor, ECF subfamily
MGGNAAASPWQATWPGLLADNDRAVRPADDDLRALMVGYQGGDRDAFEQLHAELCPLLRRHLLRLAGDRARVDDLLQDTFLQIHRARHTYDPAYPVQPWACAVARHVFLMDCRYRRRRADISRQEQLDESTPAHIPDHVDAFMARADVGRALGQLSPRTRQSVLLHHMHGLTFKEISRRLHIRGPALRARASRGIARLRETLEHHEDPHEPD